MPLAKDHYSYAEALALIAKVLPDEDPKENLLEALRDGRITAWYVNEATGEVVDLSSEVWRRYRTRLGHGLSHLVFDARTGYARLRDDLTSLSRQRGGELQIDKTSFDLLLSKTSSAVSSTTERGRGRRPARSTNSEAVYKKFDEVKRNLTFKHGEITRVAERIAADVGLGESAVQKMIRTEYHELKKKPRD